MGKNWWKLWSLFQRAAEVVQCRLVRHILIQFGLGARGDLAKGIIQAELRASGCLVLRRASQAL